MSDPKKLFLVDGSNQAFRSFFAIQSDMRAPNGFPTRALFGFTNALLKMMREHAPDYVLVAFDRGLSFRNDLYPEYKGQRPDMPADLRKQWPEFIPLCEDLGIPATAIEGFEADDIIGTLADRYGGPDLHVSIVSTDKDFAQLVSEHVDLVDMGKGTVAGPAEIEAKWGVKPDQIIELLTLMGDKSDNVPGVPGIGAKTAAKLLATYPTALDILKAAEDKKIKGKRGERIIEHGQAGFELGKALVTIHTDMELPFDLDGITRREPDWDALATRFRRYNFRRLRLFAEEQSGAPPPPPKVQAIAARPQEKPKELTAEEKRAQEIAAFKAQTRQQVTLLAIGGGLLLLAGLYTPASFMQHFVVFVLSVFVGFQVIWNVSHSLHTPLMAVTNAISSIIILGALIQIGSSSVLVTLLSILAVFMAGINIFGGFLVTRRMLAMFQKS